MTIVQCFTDMAGIERLAGALFEAQRRSAEDPTIKELFRTFVVDEVRHAHAAQMLADHYDRRKLKHYSVNPSLRRFAPAFIGALEHFSPSVANAYTTGGEIMLDIALLRSINDFVDDGMSTDVMRLINQDESRHVAMDFHMVEYYCSDAWAEKAEALPAKTPAEEVQAWSAITKMMYFAQPFFQDVFFRPMQLVDPSGKRMQEAFKRMQLLSKKEEVARTPLARLMTSARELYKNPIARKTLGPVLTRLVGLDASAMDDLFTETEARSVQGKTFDELAQETLALKYQSSSASRGRAAA